MLRDSPITYGMPSAKDSFHTATRKAPSLRALLLLLVLAPMLSCANNAYTPAVQQIPVSSITHFGDSITCGWLATPLNGTGNVLSLNGYTGLFDTFVGVPAANFCRAGDEAEDTARLWTYANSNPRLFAGQLYTMMIGTNDSSQCGVSSGCMLNYQRSLLASLAWLAIASSDKVLATSIQSRTGSWSNDLYTDLGTTQAGATLTFAVQQTTAGRPLYIAYRADDNDTGSAVVSIDGVAATTLTTNPNDGTSVVTLHGTADTIFAVSVPLGAAGSHTVQIKTASAGYFGLLWAGVPHADYTVLPGAPRVLVADIPQSAYPGLNGNIAQYNTLVQNMVGQLKTSGLNVQLAPTANALNITTDLNADGIHPNNTGHAKLAAAFESIY